MPLNFPKMRQFTSAEMDVLFDYAYGLPEYGDRWIIAKMFGEISRTKFSQDSAVQVLDHDVNYRFKLVADGGGGMELLFQQRSSKAAGYGTEAAMRPVGNGLYAVSELESYGSAGELLIKVVKLVD